MTRGPREAAPSVHPWAEGGFGRAAEAYERGRPGYPAAAVEFIAARFGLGASSVVVDLAAGTGKLARQLAATGARVVAVEPVRAMRALIPAGIEAVEGTAEAIPCADGLADAVTCAQAFQWFEPRAALAEIHRVLRAGCGLAIVTNVRDEADPLQRAFLEVLGRYRAHPRLESPQRLDSCFAPPERYRFPHVQRLDPGAFVAQAASESSIALLDDASRTSALEEFGALVADRDEVELRYVTELVVTSSGAGAY